MKRIILLSVLFLGAALGDAMADCRGKPVLDTRAALENKFVCAARAPGGNSDTWSEEHGTLNAAGVGTLTEYAKGPGHPVDPEKAVGTWTVLQNNTGNARVQYKYDGVPTLYTWSLYFISDNSYQFCDGGTIIATAYITPLPVITANPCPNRN
jgi:hypothetical protein